MSCKDNTWQTELEVFSERKMRFQTEYGAECAVELAGCQNLAVSYQTVRVDWSLHRKDKKPFVGTVRKAIVSTKPSLIPSSSLRRGWVGGGRSGKWREDDSLASFILFASFDGLTDNRLHPVAVTRSSRPSIRVTSSTRSELSCPGILVTVTWLMWRHSSSLHRHRRHA